MANVLKAADTFHAGEAVGSALPTITVYRHGNTRYRMAQINRFIAGIVPGPVTAKHGVVFKLPNNNEVALRFRPFFGRDYFYGYWNGVRFSSVGTVASRRSRVDLSTSFWWLAATNAVLAVAFWVFNAILQQYEGWAAIVFGVTAAILFAASKMDDTKPITLRFVVWSIFAVVAVSTLLYPPLIISDLMVFMLYTQMIWPAADALGLTVFTFRSVDRAKRWSKAAVVTVEDEWDQCCSCELYLPVNLFSHGSQCPRCWSKNRATTDVSFCTDDMFVASVTPPAVCDLEIAEG